MGTFVKTFWTPNRRSQTHLGQRLMLKMMLGEKDVMLLCSTLYLIVTTFEEKWQLCYLQICFMFWI